MTPRASDPTQRKLALRGCASHLTHEHQQRRGSAVPCAASAKACAPRKRSRLSGLGTCCRRCHRPRSGWVCHAARFLRGWAAAGLRSGGLLLFLGVVPATLAIEVARGVAHPIALVTWMDGLEVLDACKLKVLAVVDQFLHLQNAALRHLPLVHLLAQGWDVQSLEGATMALTSRLGGEANDLRASKRVLALQVALLAIRVVEVVGVVLLEGCCVDGRVPAQLLLPELVRVLNRKAAILQEWPQLQAACVLQVLLRLSLLLDKTSHARRERSNHQLLEVLHVQCLPDFLCIRYLGDKKLQAIVLQVSDEATDSRISQS
mmetsp:Transcript_77355/g.224428  ORF Transcript_77355/g.224428 Transcript_77355/m.224428 type:complete len:318 (+) Transcript_77355:97-1050(+)